MRGKTAPGLLVKLLALGLSTLIGIAGAELGVRLLRPQSLSVWAMTNDGMVIHRANIRDYKTVHGKNFETNSIGMRDREHARLKTNRTYRVLLFGDSFMEAGQVNRDESLPHLLQNELAQRLERPVEVINLSVSGWGTDAQLAYFERHAADYAPDLVLIAMTLHNDISDNLTEQYHQLEDGELQSRLALELPLSSYLRHKTQGWLAGNSHLYQLAAGSLRARRVIAGGRALDRHVAELLSPNPTGRLQNGWALTQALLDRFHHLASEQGAQFAVFLIPLVYGVVDARLEQFMHANRLEAVEIDLLRPQSIMREWGERNNVQVIDLQPSFHAWAKRENSDPYLTIDGHWNEDGHRLGTAEIVQKLNMEAPD